MKKITLIAFCCITLFSCSYQTIGLKGTYQTTPYETTTNSSFQQVWDKLIDLFAQKGLGIKVIDKSSGLIVAHNAMVPVTYENEKGQLADPNAWIVSPKVWEPGARKWYYVQSAAAEWNVRIKDSGNGTTKINVNLVNIVSSMAVTQLNLVFVGGTTTQVNTKAVSTGVFERMIADLIK